MIVLAAMLFGPAVATLLLFGVIALVWSQRRRGQRQPAALRSGRAGRSGTPGRRASVSEAGANGRHIVYTAASLYEAQLVLDLLSDAGIRARVFNQHLVSGFGELPWHQSLPRIWLLDEADWDAARRLIDDYEERRRDRDEAPWRCHACGEESPGNFELCWRCRAPREGGAPER